MRVASLFGLKFQNAAHKIIKKCMIISLTVLKFFILLLERKFDIGSSTPFLKMHVCFCLFSNTQWIAGSSQSDGNFDLFQRHPPYCFSKIVPRCLCRTAEIKTQVAPSWRPAARFNSPANKGRFKPKMSSVSLSSRFLANVKYEKNRINILSILGPWQPEIPTNRNYNPYRGPQVQRRNKKSRQNKFHLAAQQNKFAVKWNVTAK